MSLPPTRFPVLTVPRRRAWLRLTLSGVALAACAIGIGPRLAHAQAAPTLVEAVQLPAWVERHGDRRAAQPGISLRDGDKAQTARQARMLLRLPDRSQVKLGEATELVIEAMSVKRHGVAQPQEIQSALRLVTGVFRYATDISSKLAGHQRQLNLKLATATVGIRGTDFWSMTDADHDAVCVFEGKVAVQRDSGPDIALEKPGAFWVVFTGQPETPAGQATPDQLAKFIAQAELAPGSGVLVQGGRWRAVLGLLPTAGQAGALRDRLVEAGYPAEVMGKDGRFEVRINQFATEQDARSVVDRLSQQTELGVQDARVALAAG
ncbi:FecR family protein [Hydrogenophaga sp. NFH-34]|uniref:FecR family protein n=1 Tax=Hydrogenophaga sp. NFH-34 TaxID=2744446 RepID=UPI001F290DA1|nr:FecR family protein [Hydrogenophaga sp. NFH-34]